jgi:hypothetical protein
MLPNWAPQKKIRTWRDEGRHKDLDQWRRWGEGLVKEFGRWLARIAKVLAVLIVAIAAAVFIGWL